MDRGTFTKELAQVLRDLENEDKSKTTDRYDNDQEVYAAYQKFCYDDPIGITIHDCNLLRSALLSIESSNVNTITSNTATTITLPTTAPTHYALSSRLVNGIHQYCRNLSHKSINRSDNTASSPVSDVDVSVSLLKSQQRQSPDGDDSTATPVESESFGSALSLLLYCIHIQIPLRCCILSSSSQSSTPTHNIQQAVRYLGSYLSDTIKEQLMTTDAEDVISNAHDTFNDNNNNIIEAVTDPTNNGVDGLVENVLNGNGHFHNHNENDDTGSLQEVFAAESDDSDYEYESDHIFIQQQENLEHDAQSSSWVASITNAYDPTHLSKVNLPPTIKNVEEITWDHISITIVQLIESIVPFTSWISSTMSIQNWIKYKISDTFIQLCLALLCVPLPTSATSISSTNPTTTSSDIFHASSVSPQQWQRLGICTLNIFRDITIHRMNISDDEQNAAVVLKDYLRLVRILVQNQNTPKIDKDQHLMLSTSDATTTSTLIGISSLSSLCYEIISNNNYQQQTTATTYPHKSTSHKILHIVQSNVIDLCDDLTTILEGAVKMDAAKSLSTDCDDDVMTIQWAYLSMLKILSLPTNIGLYLSPNINVYAHSLLNSGLFRQWLITWSKQYLKVKEIQENTSRTNQLLSCNCAVQECILELCIVCPTLLGKYAWRFPGFADAVLYPLATTTTTTLVDQSSQRITTLIWNLLGCQYYASPAQNASTFSTFQWKSKMDNTKKLINESNSDNSSIQQKLPITAETCQEQVWVIFQSLCTDTVRILTDWKIRHEHHIMDATTPVIPTATANSPLYNVTIEWENLMNRFKTHQFLIHLFFEARNAQAMQHLQLQQEGKEEAIINNDRQSSKFSDASTIIYSELAPIQYLLASIQTISAINKNELDTDDVQRFKQSSSVSKSVDVADDEDFIDLNKDNSDSDDEEYDRLHKKKNARRQLDCVDRDLKSLNRLRVSVKSFREAAINAAAATTHVNNAAVNIPSSMTSKID